VRSEEVIIIPTLNAELDGCNIQFRGLLYDHFDFEAEDEKIEPQHQ